jgi:molecular chaperone DnaJ
MAVQEVSVVRGENVRTEVDVPSAEVAQGTDALVDYEVLARCRVCTGRGWVGPEGPECDACEGTGTVIATRRLRLLIPPGVEDGTELRVRAEGDDAGTGSLPGDLLVRVSVVKAEDTRVVRYAALVLLLLAVATLVLYLVARMGTA